MVYLKNFWSWIKTPYTKWKRKQALKKKLEELQKLRKEKKLKKEAKPSNDLGLPKLNRDALPPVQMNRRGQFEMIPDFL